MFRDFTSSAGFAVAPPHERTPQGTTLPALIASFSLALSIAIVLTAVTVTAVRAVQLF